MENQRKGVFRGYYISAYSLAVKHGFQGTEEEWCKSLNGESVELRFHEEKVQWKLASQTGWQTLFCVDDLRAYVINQVLTEAKDAAEKAGDRKEAAVEAALTSTLAATESKEASVWARNAERNAGASAEQAAAQNIASAQNAAAAMEAEEIAKEKAAEAKISAEAAAKAAKEAQSAAGGGVATFNGRSGSVMPQSGDYSPDMVGAAPAAHAKNAAMHLLEGDRDNWNGKMAKGVAFELVLKADDWEDQTQVVEDVRLQSEGYACFVAPGDASWLAYGAAQIRAGNVTEDGKLTFCCEIVPIVDLTVNILMVEVVQ